MQIYPVFFLIPFSCSRVPPSSCLLEHLLAVTASRTGLVFADLSSFEWCPSCSLQNVPLRICLMFSSDVICQGAQVVQRTRSRYCMAVLLGMNCLKTLTRQKCPGLSLWFFYHQKREDFLVFSQDKIIVFVCFSNWCPSLLHTIKSDFNCVNKKRGEINEEKIDSICFKSF